MNEEFPVVTPDAIAQFEVAFKQVYPHQGLPKNPADSLERMLRKSIESSPEEWEGFIGSSDQSGIVISDRYEIVVEKSPLRVSEVRVRDRCQRRFAADVLDLGKVRFTRTALTAFKEKFPEYVQGEVEGSARHILSQATEWGAMSRRKMKRRLATHGTSRYLRYMNCRFVLSLKDEFVMLVVTVEDVRQ